MIQNVLDIDVLELREFDFELVCIGDDGRLFGCVGGQRFPAQPDKIVSGAFEDVPVGFEF